MGLETYRRKRDFAATPEPEGEVGPSDPSRLTYVIQQHAARRLHYDFRLELDGVLLSWAVPKGPSLDPGDKRLAVRTEDHPLAYGAFEGTIPKGEYGGGTVLLWDRGTWTPHGDARASLDAGRLTFELHGERLGGRWHLVRSARGADWLLIKGDDTHARRGHGTDAVDGHDTSVTTGRDLARIASAADRVWTREAGEVHPDDPVAGIDDLPGAIRGEVAWPLAPSLATAVDAAPDGERWIHELKLDGYRILARSTGDGASLVTRSGLDWTARLAPIARAVEALGVPGLILDGELVAVEPNGRTSFSALQRALSDGSGRLELH
ncbi:MAG: DNA polymerase ligase N-terminal domain-containing protein, partial [Myxococcota bacterium]